MKRALLAMLGLAAIVVAAVFLTRARQTGSADAAHSGAGVPLATSAPPEAARFHPPGRRPPDFRTGQQYEAPLPPDEQASLYDHARKSRTDAFLQAAGLDAAAGAKLALLVDEVNGTMDEILTELEPAYTAAPAERERRRAAFLKSFVVLSRRAQAGLDELGPRAAEVRKQMYLNISGMLNASNNAGLVRFGSTFGKPIAKR